MLVRTNIYLESETIRYYKQLAKQRGVSMSDLIREVLQQQRAFSYPGPKQALDQIVHDAQPGQDYESDTSTHHDYYLYTLPSSDESIR